MSQFVRDTSRVRSWTFAVAAAALSACANETILLNSERIEQRFGSFGIDILESDPYVRRSNLYSTDDGLRTCRTYAVVEFADRVDPNLAAGHEAVVAGRSLGATFKERGWKILKQSVYIGAFKTYARGSALAELMRLNDERVPALHVYRLTLSKDDRTYDYATIAEAHHPDYLSISDLQDIYPRSNENGLSTQALSELGALFRPD